MDRFGKNSLVLVLALVFSVVAGPLLFSQEKHLMSVSTASYGTLPLGSSGDLFNPGFGTELSAFFIPSFSPYFGISAGGNFLYLPLESADSIWALGGGGGPVFQLPLGSRFTLYGYGLFGYYQWSPIGWDSGDGSGGSLMVRGSAGLNFRLTGPFTLGLAGSYDYLGGLYNGFSVNLALKFDIPITPRSRQPRIETYMDKKPGRLETGKGVELRDINLTHLFPVLYKYYDTNPVGTARVKNFEKKVAEEVKISFYVERYMDNPMESTLAFNLEPGEEKTINLVGLFTDDLMKITEGTKASARITLSYTMAGKTTNIDYTPILEVHNRNALMWDDDSKIASFVTAKDPAVLSFSKNVMSWMQEEANPAVDEHLQKGMALFEAIKSYGIRYQIDPSTPFSEFSQAETAIDFVQFPRQTLEYTNGDCDDLSALYTAMLESVGIETAFITIPGHIYAAFALKAPPEEARKAFSKSDELVFQDDKAWVPVEITMFQSTFEKAWQTGAKEWRENVSKEQAGFFPTRNSWERYQAVGFSESSLMLSLPDKQAVTAGFNQTLRRYIDREMYPQISAIQAKMGQSRAKHRLQNSLGVLYARYGLYDQAAETFQEILKSTEYKLALINLGNIHFIRQDFEGALGFYERVLLSDGGDRTALLGVSRCHHELENYGLVAKTFDQLKAVDPETASRFAYLDLRGEEASRAADVVGLKHVVLWEEEETE